VSSGTEVLGFLFLPSPPQPTAIACRDWMLQSERAEGVKDRKILKTYEDKSDSGAPLALVDYEQAPPPARFVRRFFVAQGDLCADIAISAPMLLSADASSSLQKTLVFDPNRPPDFLARFRYAQVLYDHKQFAAAAPIFEQALTQVSTMADPQHWQRVATDQASMAYGISGDLAKSRALNEAAILKDPDYPLYYYNLACADADSGDAAAARNHLEQAFARKANTLPTESMPDPTKDDSFLKLKSDKPFWTFVESLPKT
jgi:tetratricopeptide (TPR) repeat protein